MIENKIVEVCDSIINSTSEKASALVGGSIVIERYMFSNQNIYEIKDVKADIYLKLMETEALSGNYEINIIGEKTNMSVIYFRLTNRQ